jgi:hypothetical protein
MAKKQYEVKTLEARVMDVAYIWDRHVLHTDESVILACLLNTKGQGRSSSDMKDVQRIMKDKNLELTK